MEPHKTECPRCKNKTMQAYFILQEDMTNKLVEICSTCSFNPAVDKLPDEGKTIEHEIWDRYQDLRMQVQLLACIVQNPGMKIEKERLDEHHKLTLRVCEELYSLNTLVMKIKGR